MTTRSGGESEPTAETDVLGEEDGEAPFPVSAYGDNATVWNIDPEDEAHWNWVKGLFQTEFGAFEPIYRILDVVRSRKCRTVVVEHQYVDADYRSEYSSFW